MSVSKHASEPYASATDLSLGVQLYTKVSHRPIAEVLNPALQRGGLSGCHDDLDPGVVDEDGRVLAVDLVVVLRDGVARPANAT